MPPIQLKSMSKHIHLVCFCRNSALQLLKLGNFQIALLHATNFESFQMLRNFFSLVRNFHRIGGKNSTILVGKCRKLRQQHYQIHRSDNQKKGIFRLFKIFLCSKVGEESLLFKHNFPQNIWLSSSAQPLAKVPNINFNAEEGFPQRISKTTFLISFISLT